MQYLWLALAFLVGAIGVVVGRLLKLSPPTTVTLSTVPAFLALFPFMKRWMPQAKFRYWAMAAALSAFFAWLLYNAFDKLGWG